MEDQPDEYFRVEFSEPFEADMDVIYLRLSKFSAEAAHDWQTGVIDACFSLIQFPRRCRLIPDSDDFQQEVRQLNYRYRRKVYPILFTIFEATDDSSAEVRILRIRNVTSRRGTAKDE